MKEGAAMEKLKVGILHPGKMGIFVAACIQKNGYHVYWASAGRSQPTRQRAEEHQLQDAGTLASLCETCQVLVSVCPPHAAEEMADQVMGLSFRGQYLELNAVSPQKVITIGQKMQGMGIAFVDGGIIGEPAWEKGKTYLYLAGEQAAEAAALFATGSMETHVIGDRIGLASALKMCYSAYTKGTTALLGSILAAAQELGVREGLEAQWAMDWPGFAERARERVRKVTFKAWRFAGEMEEIAATFQDAGLPGEFYLAAAQIYRRMAGYKNAPSEPRLEDVLRVLIDKRTSKKMDLSGGHLAALPSSIKGANDLEELDLDQNQLGSLPDWIGELTNLTALSLYSNQLVSLPESIWQLTNLRRLNLADNHLSCLSERIGGLVGLQMLDLGHNELIGLPESIGNLSSLAFLYLSNNRLASLPGSFERLGKLLYLNITDNQLTLFPQQITSLTLLVELRLYHNQLASLPETLGQLVHLKEMHLMDNRLESLPETIGNLAGLRKLILQNNRLTLLPESIGNLNRLTDLDLRNNRLESLPESIGALKNLRYLDLRANQLVSLPDSIAGLTNLEKLDLRWNKLLLLPGWLQMLEEGGCTVFI
jgi:Leucine-rich repeat (LRR) protein/3-hydroxyisobutyrate dehydrogenase-like beta-hydroxyacid dehydrogenase